MPGGTLIDLAQPAVLDCPAIMTATIRHTIRQAAARVRATAETTEDDGGGMMAKAKAKVSPGIRSRNVGLQTIRVADIEDNPGNFRTHPIAQHDALAGTVAELGFYGYPDCYETADGQIRLIDGHLRKSLLIEKYGPDATIEVNVTDFDEDEARKAMLTHDPLAAMAEMDDVKLDELLRSVDVTDAALTQMLADLAEEAGVIPSEESETELKPLKIMPPPPMTWVLVGIPTVRFGEINQQVEAFAGIDGIILETTSNGG